MQATGQKARIQECADNLEEMVPRSGYITLSKEELKERIDCPDYLFSDVKAEALRRGVLMHAECENGPWSEWLWVLTYDPTHSAGGLELYTRLMSIWGNGMFFNGVVPTLQSGNSAQQLVQSLYRRNLFADLLVTLPLALGTTAADGPITMIADEINQQRAVMPIEYRDGLNQRLFALRSGVERAQALFSW